MRNLLRTIRNQGAAALLGALFIVSFLGLYAFATHMRVEIAEVAKPGSNGPQWTLAQAEAGVLKLQLATEYAIDDPGDRAKLAEVRQRFDFFFGWVQNIQNSRGFAALRLENDFAHDLARLQEFLARNIPLIDGPDSELQAGLPIFLTEAKTAYDAARRLNINGFDEVAAQADSRREQAGFALLQSTLLAVMMLFLMVLLLALLTVQLRRGKLYAEEQQRLRQRVEAVIGTSVDAVIATDHKGNVIDVNQVAEKLFGFERAEILGKPIDQFMVPEHQREAFREQLELQRTTGKSQIVGAGQIERNVLTKSGRTFPAEFAINAVGTGDDLIFVGFLRDISDRRAAQEEMRLAHDQAVAGENAKAALLAVMSHEIRTPLNGMLGSIDLLESGDLTKEQSAQLNVMKSSGQMLLHHVNDVLDISKLDAGMVEFSKEHFDLTNLLAEVVRGQNTVATAKGVALICDVADASLTDVIGDANRVRQVILNLVGNAVKFTSKGEIRVEAERLDGETVEIRVSDTGPGISEDAQKLIFDDFVTLDQSYTRAAQGTGLGLGIVRRLVDAMSGQIEVESEAGEGSLFSLRLPLPTAAKTSDAAMPTLTARGQLNKLKILLVEDNEINRQVLGEMLRKDGHNVTEAHDGIQGVETAAGNAFDLILMDVSMPRLDGVAATREIRLGSGPNAKSPIIGVTAHVQVEQMEKFKDAGMTSVVTKPVSWNALRNALGGVDFTTGPHQVNGDLPLIDQAVLDALKGRFNGKFKAMCERFEVEADMLFNNENLSGGIAADELHKFAGSAAIFGARRLHAFLASLEKDIRAGKVTNPISEFERLRMIWDETKDALGECRAAA